MKSSIKEESFRPLSLLEKVRDSTKKYTVEVGAKVGILTLLGVIGRSKNGAKVWRCLCDCGNIKDIVSSSLRAGLTRSCGCFYLKCSQDIRKTHGMSGSTEYHSWAAMKQRCYYQGHQEYENYGGRGIAVCEEWLDSFESFLQDMGHKPSEKHSIDRIDVNGNYCKENCKWSTPKEQAANTRKVLSEMSGISWHKITGKWQLVFNKKYVGLFSTQQEALEFKNTLKAKDNHGI